jgi:hypothetical protein
MVGVVRYGLVMTGCWVILRGDGAPRGYSWSRVWVDSSAESFFFGICDLLQSARGGNPQRRKVLIYLRHSVNKSHKEELEGM